MDNNSEKHVVVVGAGIAGMEAAIQLSQFGHNVTLVEKEEEAGGHLRQWNKLFPDNSSPGLLVNNLESQLKRNKVKTFFGTEITKIEKNSGKFMIESGKHLKITADSLMLTTGFKLFDAARKEEYGYGLFENVISSADLEKRLKEDKKLTTSGGAIPNRIAFIHCVGSRDEKMGNTYCSKVCCITGIKQALEINKMYPDCEVFCFYMDLRLYASIYDSMYLEAQRKNKIQFIRGRLSEAAEKMDKKLQIKAEDTLSGRPIRMDVDMIVLLTGMEANESHYAFTKNKYLQSDQNGFFKANDIQTSRNKTEIPGLFIAGTCVCPMSVNETLENARSASLAVNNYIKNSM